MSDQLQEAIREGVVQRDTGDLSNEVEAERVSSRETVAGIEQALGENTVQYGINEVTYNLAGRSAAFVRDSLSAILNAPPEAKMFIDGNEVTHEVKTIIGTSQKIEFLAVSGRKGISR